MAKERELQAALGSQGPANGGGGGDSDEDGGGGGGVVEFGDAEDEPDWEFVARTQRHQKERPPASGAGGGGGDGQQQRQGGRQRGGNQQQAQQQQAAKRPPAVTHKVGEMARAGAPVPEAQRSVIFGDAGDADAAPADWAGLGLCQVLADHLAALNFTAPTLVQRGALPALLAGRDAMVRAPTGSGKTLAYLAPMVQQLQAASPRIARSEGTYGLVLSPTRELAVQISDVLVALCRRFNWLVPGVLIGGEHRGHEKARLRKGVTVLVATPGRLLDHLQNTTSFRTDALSWLVLDEADRLMDLGFESKVKEIVTTLDARNASLEDHDGGRGSGSSPAAAGYGQQRRQTVLLSATLPPALGAFARQLMRPGAAAVGFSAAALNDPDAAAQLEQDTLEGGDAGAEEGAGAGGGGGLPQKAAATASAGPEKFEIPSQLRQAFVEVPAKLRLAALVAALRARLSPRRGGGGAAAVAKIVVFFSNCASVEFHHALLTRCSGGNGGGGGGGEDSDEDDGGGGVGGLLPVAPLKLHGDLPQAERTSNMLRFAKASTGVLLCTDVAARGLDFPKVTAILQYDPAGEPAEYVHRVGRTARLGQGGEALMLLLPGERGYVELMAERGVALKEEPLPSLLRALPPAPSPKHAKRPWHDAGGGGVGEGSPEVLSLQRRLMAVVSGDPKLQALAADAFRSFLRAYAVHPSHLKPIFRVKALHLGHVAASFALQEQPSALGGSGASKERKRRKAEARFEEAARGKKKMRASARAAAAGGR